MKQSAKAKVKDSDELLERIAERLDIITVLLLYQSGLSGDKVAGVLHVRKQKVGEALPLRKLTRWVD
ncbi:hypothetical protein CH330_03830 [candidate division WOR-3 bacterium JGI_Cruoil_03_51_56]|uniref:Uncharacterized protein n=1 Tax=candidate division WOR-3 bacterium JGI_Cruoil_03_51_56 TaxID=1973747 RepID=A0A235BWW8_UNCW3|nr:MAG: hypothetical protein CH330_03830 [candidate division WOR-3 bacterium JGI_Cruoil_03_51_56]